MTMAGTSSKHRENPHISDEEFQQDQSALIKDLVSRIKEMEDTLSIMKDAEVKASMDDHDKPNPIDIKDIERPDKCDKQAAKFNTWLDKFKDLLTSRNGNWEQLLGLIENRGKVTINGAPVSGCRGENTISVATRFIPNCSFMILLFALIVMLSDREPSASDTLTSLTPVNFPGG